MFRALSAIAVAAAVAGAVTVFPSLSDSVEARSPAANGVTLDVVSLHAQPLSTECAQQTWPYLETKCLRDDNRPMGQARDVRLVSLDKAHADAASKAKVR
jgi:hypothetical protein